jgi:hypothetical protein
MHREHINPLQWHQAVGVARQACARIFRDGGSPADALASFGLTRDVGEVSWSRAVEMIAQQFCLKMMREAA